MTDLYLMTSKNGRVLLLNIFIRNTTRRNKIFFEIHCINIMLWKGQISFFPTITVRNTT